MVERIKQKAVMISLLRQRKPLFPNIRIFREDILVRAELIGERLRDPQFFADVAANTILMMSFSRILGAVL